LNVHCLVLPKGSATRSPGFTHGDRTAASGHEGNSSPAGADHLAEAVVPFEVVGAVDGAPGHAEVVPVVAHDGLAGRAGQGVGGHELSLLRAALVDAREVGDAEAPRGPPPPARQNAPPPPPPGGGGLPPTALLLGSMASDGEAEA